MKQSKEEKRNAADNFGSWDRDKENRAPVALQKRKSVGVESKKLKSNPDQGTVETSKAQASKAITLKTAKSVPLGTGDGGGIEKTQPPFLRRQNALPVREKNGKQPEALQRVATRSTVPFCKKQSVATQRTNPAFELGENAPAQATLRSRFGFRKVQKFTLPSANTQNNV